MMKSKTNWKFLSEIVAVAGRCLAFLEKSSSYSVGAMWVSLLLSLLLFSLTPVCPGESKESFLNNQGVGANSPLTSASCTRASCSAMSDSISVTMAWNSGKPRRESRVLSCLR